MGGAFVSPRQWERPAPSRTIASSGLEQLGAVAATLCAQDLGGSLARALEMLRWVSGADDGEAFLSDPSGHELWMTACEGPDADVLLERLHFEQGQGFPGLSAVGAVASRGMCRDPRFLRDGPKRRGLRAYLGMPIPGPHGSIGSLAMAWYRPDVPLDDLQVLFSQVATQIGATVTAALSASTRPGRNDGALPPTCWSALRDAMHHAGARRGLVLLDDEQGGVNPLIEAEPLAAACVRCRETAGACTLLQAARSEPARDPRELWRACTGPLAQLGSVVPVPFRGRRHGLLVLDYGERVPSPPTRDVVALIHAALPLSDGVGAHPRPSDRAPIALAQARGLALRCLGPLEVHVDGRPVPRQAFRRRKALALLEILLARGAPLPRAVLLEALWPGREPDAAANNLYGVVHALRAGLACPTIPSHAVVSIDGDRYGLEPAVREASDLAAYLSALRAAEKVQRRGAIDEAIPLLQDALSRYTGDLFEGDDDVELVVAERATLRQQFTDAVLMMAGLLRQRGDRDGRVHWLLRAARFDQLHEELQRQLAEALAGVGRTAEAGERLRAHCAALWKELAVHPSEETEALKRRLGL